MLGIGAQYENADHGRFGLATLSLRVSCPLQCSGPFRTFERCLKEFLECDACSFEFASLDDDAAIAERASHEVHSFRARGLKSLPLEACDGHRTEIPRNSR